MAHYYGMVMQPQKLGQTENPENLKSHIYKLRDIQRIDKYTETLLRRYFELTKCHLFVTIIIMIL